jgi:large subunit ribosomal protein L33
MEHPADEFDGSEPAKGSIGDDLLAREPREARAAADRRQRIVLSCAQCGGRNYRKTKARNEGAPPLQLKKFCSICNAHTQHREAV